MPPAWLRVVCSSSTGNGRTVGVGSGDGRGVLVGEGGTAVCVGSAREGCMGVGVASETVVGNPEAILSGVSVAALDAVGGIVVGTPAIVSDRFRAIKVTPLIIMITTTTIILIIFMRCECFIVCSHSIWIVFLMFYHDQ
jgi:hypothetical protein